jgi:uncharacterized phage-like protein YoqJ
VIIAATGHRPEKLGGYGRPDVRAMLLQVATEYLTLHPRVSEVVSGMAQGWDQAFAHAAYDLKIPCVAAVPFIGHERPWPEQAQAYYRRLLDRSARVVVVSTGGYTPDKMQLRNEWMVEYSHRICALFDGSPGGTANCIDYANAMGRPIDNLWSEFKCLRS